jgi:hypothetical protein
MFAEFMACAKALFDRSLRTVNIVPSTGLDTALYAELDPD